MCYRVQISSLISGKDRTSAMNLESTSTAQISIQGQWCIFVWGFTTLQLCTLLTADNIKATIEEILGPEGYNIREFVNSGTSNNATNVVSALKRMHLTQVGCQAHKVNLAVKASVGGEVAQLKLNQGTPMKWKISKEISIFKYLIMAFSFRKK